MKWIALILLVGLLIMGIGELGFGGGKDWRDSGPPGGV